MNKKIDLITIGIEDDLSIVADRIKLHRAFGNVISNAIKFTPHKGEIKIHVIKKVGAYLITIQDNGIGIPEDLQTKLFQRFTNSQRLGTDGEASTGLGMFLTQQVIEAHNGTISLTSVEGYGTKVYIEIPNT